jgi:RNA polymerase sigma-70 factor (ECF subfamily)
LSEIDPDILERARGGDREAIGLLLEPEMGRVYATCRRMVGSRDDAEELAQDALIRVIRGLASFDGRSSLSTWITRVTINTCLTWLRTRARRAGKEPVAIENPDLEPARPESGNSPDGRGVQEDEGGVHRVEEALSRLNPEHRAVLVLRDVRGLDYESIASALDLAVGTVKSRIFRARAALRAEIESIGGSEEPIPADRT